MCSFPDGRGMSLVQYHCIFNPEEVWTRKMGTRAMYEVLLMCDGSLITVLIGQVVSVATACGIPYVATDLLT